MITKHEIKIIISSTFTDDQRARFMKDIIDPLIKEIASNWPSIRIEQTKEKNFL